MKAKSAKATPPGDARGYLLTVRLDPKEEQKLRKLALDAGTARGRAVSLSDVVRHWIAAGAPVLGDGAEWLR
jgi:hypothetical protein